MYIGKTYQEYLESASGTETGEINFAFLLKCVDEYASSEWFKTACKAERYYNGDNDIINNRHKYAMRKATVYEDGRVVRAAEPVERETNIVTSNFFGRNIIQRVQYLFQGGLALDKQYKDLLGRNFDRVMEEAAKNAIIHGESYVYWAYDHAECLKAASDNGFSGMFLLLDEENGEPRIGVRFWRLSSKRPQYVLVYTPDGTSLIRRDIGKDEKAKKKKPEFTIVNPKKGYVRVLEEVDGKQTERTEGYNALPVCVFYGNDYSCSELTHNLKSKIDLYDKIVSDFGDNLERMEGIYWILKNFGGTPKEAAIMLAEMEEYKTAFVKADDGTKESSASPQSIEAPYAARSFALSLLSKEIYKEMMALNMSEVTGGSLTNVAIDAAKADLDMAANQLETQAFACLLKVFDIVGRPDLYDLTDNYLRQFIANRYETVQMVYSTGLDADIPRKQRLEQTGLFDDEEIAAILVDMEAQDQAGLDNAAELDAAMKKLQASQQQQQQPNPNDGGTVE